MSLYSYSRYRCFWRQDHPEDLPVTMAHSLIKKRHARARREKAEKMKSCRKARFLYIDLPFKVKYQIYQLWRESAKRKRNPKARRRDTRKSERLNPAPFRFLDLPLEIRCQIYQLCLVKPPVIFPNESLPNPRRLCWPVDFNDRPPILTPRPLDTNLLLVCSQIYDEACPILYGSTTFIISDWGFQVALGKLIRFLAGLTEGSRKLLRSVKMIIPETFLRYRIISKSQSLNELRQGGVIDESKAESFDLLFQQDLVPTRQQIGDVNAKEPREVVRYLFLRRITGPMRRQFNGSRYVMTCITQEHIIKLREWNWKVSISAHAI